MTTDPLTDHIDADILERCAGDIEAAAAWQIQTLRMQLASARKATEEATRRTFELSELVGATRAQAVEPAALLREVVAYALGDTERAWSQPADNIWRRAVEVAFRHAPTTTEETR